MNERPTPETGEGSPSLANFTIQKFERERDEALEECRHLRDWKREMMIVDSEWDEVREYIRNQLGGKRRGSFAKITLQFINERDEALDEIKAMREAIKEAHKAIRMGPYPEHSVLAKLQPFLA